MRMILEAEAWEVIDLLAVATLGMDRVHDDVRTLLDEGVVLRWLSALLVRWDELEAHERYAFSSLIAYRALRVGREA